VISSAAQRLLVFLDRPPIIARLVPDGNNVVLHTYLSGRLEPTVSWGADNLHIFVVASLALAIAAPGARRIERIAIASAAIFLFTLALTLVELQCVAGAYAVDHLGFRLYSPGETTLLNWASRGMVTVGMLLLPSFLFLIAFVGTWATVDPPIAASAPSRQPGEPTARFEVRKRLGWAVTLAIAAVSVVLACFLAPSPGMEEFREGLERIAALNPSSAQAQMSLALFLEDGGRFPEAEAYYEGALRLDPGMEAARFNLGNVRFKRGDFTGAAQAYQEVLGRDAAHLAARNNLGNAYFKMGRFEESAKVYEEVLQAEPGRAPTQKNLAEALRRLGRPCEALSHLRQSADLDQKLAETSAVQSEIALLRSGCGKE
jgi:tetratricopeptide (TPR) repeat protein